MVKISPQRKSIRLRKYDYALPGYYYITLCTQNRKCLFGNIVVGVGRDQPVQKMVLNNAGQLVANIWQSLPDCYPVELDVFQIMPNHVHFVLVISPPRRGIACNAQSNGNARSDDAGFARKTPTAFGNVTAGSLPCVIRSFKSECTKQIRRILKNPHMVIWQRNYWEHVIRNETDLNKIRQYIKNNPQVWDRDRNNPENWEKIDNTAI